MFQYQHGTIDREWGVSYDVKFKDLYFNTNMVRLIVIDYLQLITKTTDFNTNMVRLIASHLYHFTHIRVTQFQYQHGTIDSKGWHQARTERYCVSIPTWYD